MHIVISFTHIDRAMQGLTDHVNNVNHDARIVLSFTHIDRATQVDTQGPTPQRFDLLDFSHGLVGRRRCANKGEEAGSSRQYK